MAQVFITGSSQGLGFLAARYLAGQGHDVVLHARNATRAENAKAALPQAAAVLIGDVSTLAAMRELAEQANALGRFDAVIHNVAVGFGGPRREATADGFCLTWAVNVLAPYALTALMHRPDRLIYLGSNMHSGGASNLDDPNWTSRRWNGGSAYSDSKLHDLWLAFAIARRWPGVRSNAVDPGWVPTRMGGAGAPDDLELGCQTQAWLAVSDDPEALTTGGYFHHRRRGRPSQAALDAALQDRLLDYCREISGIPLSPV